MSKRTAAPAASVKVPRTNWRYSQQLHRHLRPRVMKSASISKNSLFTAWSVIELNGASNRRTQHLDLNRPGTVARARRITPPPPLAPGLGWNGPPSFGARPRQLVGVSVCAIGNDL